MLKPGELIVPERPAYPFLVESEAQAAPLPPTSPAAGAIGYKIALTFVHNVALNGKAFIMGWHQGANARDIAAGLRRTADRMEAYANEIEALNAPAANESEPAQVAGNPKANGGEHPPEPGKALDPSP